VLIQLEKFLEMASEEKVSEVISIFKCEKDIDIENFIKDKAIQFEKKSKSRTSLIMCEEALASKQFKVLGYFSVAMQTLKIPEGTSQSQIRKLDGLYAKRGGDTIVDIPAFLIGQLGKNSLYKDNISGDVILEYAISSICKAQEYVGGRIVFIECQDNPKLIDFYSNNGFKKFRKDPNDGLIQMIRLLESDDKK